MPLAGAAMNAGMFQEMSEFCIVLYFCCFQIFFLTTPLSCQEKKKKSFLYGCTVYICSPTSDKEALSFHGTLHTSRETEIYEATK